MKIVRIGSSAMLALLVLGCNGGIVVHERHDYPPPPLGATVYVAPNPGGPGIVFQEAEILEAPTAPPAPMVEVRVAPERPGAVWIDGNWVYGRNGWRWSQGHWAYDRHEGEVYVAGGWEQRHGSWVWVEGRWNGGEHGRDHGRDEDHGRGHDRDHASGTVVVEPGPGLPGVSLVFQEMELLEAPIAPPAPVVEVRTASPHRDAVWIEGNWVYGKKGWHWAKGHWFQGEHSGTVYVAGRWEDRHGNYVWIEGSWK